ncbi:MAG TPA: M28 family peptidase [Anaerolineales bacterium]|mgnify:CR=1 FL=1|nr:M28 family peptidase [Anaerolineales bacterium]HRQ92907.1 M28 family peptidase [Anaerolineales bacterium]
MFSRERPDPRILLFLLFLIVFGVAMTVFSRRALQEPAAFNGQSAFAHAEAQMAFGPRTPGSEAHEQTRAYIAHTLARYGWEPEQPVGELLGQPVYNIIATWPSSEEDAPWIILGAHYDSRFFADYDPDPANHSQPVPGANDGASGVAVLLELARVLPLNNPNATVTLAFFDAEDNGGIEGWDWIMGSRLAADGLTELPDAVVILDMIGDADLQIYLERNSDPRLAAEIWAQAAELGYADIFINEPKYTILDDHTPFLAREIPAVDIIDFDYPYWHTVQDTLDKISPQSLQTVGEVVLAWVLGK